MARSSPSPSLSPICPPIRSNSPSQKPRPDFRLFLRPRPAFIGRSFFTNREAGKNVYSMKEKYPLSFIRMKKAMNKILLVSAGALSLLALSGCTSIWDLITGGGSASSELLQSTKTGATYGAVERAADSSGTNYSSSSSKYTYRELGEAGGDYYLNSVGTYNLWVIPVAIRDYSSNATETVRN